MRAPKTGVPVKIALKYRTIGPCNPLSWRYARRGVPTGEFPFSLLVSMPAPTPKPISQPHPDPHALGRIGFVHIVGAGPGSADLMTLRALDRLQRAEVVVHDPAYGPQPGLLIIGETVQLSPEFHAD